MTDCQLMHQAWPSLFNSSDPIACCSNVTAITLSANSPNGGIVCDQNHSITSIIYSNVGLTGAFPTKLPAGLTYLDVSINNISGTLSRVLPSSLATLIVWGNNLTGTIPPLPSGMIYLEIANNYFVGSLPDLPSGLGYLDTYTNNLTGTIPKIPEAMQYLELQQNQLTGPIPSLPSNLLTLYLAQNELSGPIPPLPSTLLELDLSDNQLNGTIPFSKLPHGSVLNGNCFDNAGRSVANKCPQQPSQPISLAAILGIVAGVLAAVACGVVFLLQWHRSRRLLSPEATATVVDASKEPDLSTSTLLTDSIEVVPILGNAACAAAGAEYPVAGKSKEHHDLFDAMSTRMQEQQYSTTKEQHDLFDVMPAAHLKARELMGREIEERDPREWSVEDVGMWLRGLRYGEDVVASFQEQGCTGAGLKTLSANEDACFDALASKFGFFGVGK
ncbi:hypothetical protein HDU98_005015, partial [Podochytrium sp. JEL0797]